MMRRFLLHITLFSFLLPYLSFAQISRTEAMGGLSFSIIDEDTKLDPFQLGGNPAYLWKSRVKPRLDLTQFNEGDYGNYKRKFSSERNLNIGAKVLGIQPLGKSGTFQGRALYIYDKRSEVYRTLKYDTYAGEAFYFTDTTSGDVVYDGPLFEFSHSLPLNDEISVGGVFGYGLLNGLKKVYTYGETVYRNVYGKIGATYSASENLSFGLDFSMFDIQERITASDVNLFTVITYHYRGDTHRVQLSGSKQNYKVAKNGGKFGAQVYYKTNDNFELGAYCKYGVSSTESIYPVQGMETTDGYSQFEDFSFELQARKKITENITVSAIANYFDTFSWSKSAQTNLLLWKWDFVQTSAGLGATFEKIIPRTLLGIEYRLVNESADSNKYIDNTQNALNSLNHDVKLGVEYALGERVSLRGGFSFLLMNNDFLFGGENVSFEKFAFGLGWKPAEAFIIDLYGFYAIRSESTTRKREFWNTSITFRFLTF